MRENSLFEMDEWMIFFIMIVVFIWVWGEKVLDEWKQDVEAVSLLIVHKSYQEHKLWF